MTGIRTVVGFGRIDRGSGDTKTSMSQLPVGTDGMLTKKPSTYITNGDLSGRFGAGVTCTFDRSRDMEYKYDLGIREVTVASPGMYELGFSLEGYVTVSNLKWLQYLFQTKEIELKADTPIYNADCTPVTDLETRTKDVYIANSRGRLIRSGIPVKSYRDYMEFIDKNTEGEGASAVADGKVSVVYCDYPESPEETMFDIAYVQSNSRAMGGKINEIGIYCGCMIESGTISYEAGSDYGIKFTLNGFALRDYLETVSDELYYQDYIQSIDSDILAVGCLSVAQKKDTALSAISYTDSASFTVNNTLDKIPECNEITYGGAVIGTIAYELAVQTYSNDPNRYINAMLGYDTDFASGKLDTVSDMSNVYTPQRVPRKINKFKIRSSDDYGGRSLEKFIDILTFENVVSGVNKEFDVDNRIMDDPTIVPLKAMVIYGYLASNVKPLPCNIADDDVEGNSIEDEGNTTMGFPFNEVEF